MGFFRKYIPQHSVEGEVGIEIEVEGRRLPPRIEGWTTTRDGSLRGDSYEYVLTNPIPRDRVREYLDRVSLAYENAGSVIPDSPRTSVHVHVNVQNMSIGQTFSYILTYLMFEDMLVESCGADRVGNVYCLRASDAEGLLFYLKRLARNCDWHVMREYENTYRYASINVSAIAKYGSLEFRAMRGTPHMRDIEAWTGMLLRIKDMASCYCDPRNLIAKLSADGVEAFVEEVFGRDADIITNKKNWQHRLLANMRELQTIAYSGDWNNINFIDEPIEDI